MTRIIDKISESCGKLGGIAAFILLFFIVGNVILRFIFTKNFNFMLELEYHLFGMIFLLGGAGNILSDKHVRVDFFYSHFSDKVKSTVNLVMHILFLIPWTLMGIYTCTKYAANSFYIREASANPGGLPALYPVKFLIVLCFIILLLQAISEIIKQIRYLSRQWKS
jgi:TRAP-type mannitol/chloroaromatic compound transport system permease small subunit